MPDFEAPRSHAARVLFLTRSAQTGQADITAGRNYVSQPTVDAINLLLPTYRSAVSAIPAAAAGRSKEIREKNEAAAVVATYTRDFWEVLKRRVKRLGEPAEVLLFYGLPLDGTVPRPMTADEWIQHARTCVDGDAAAVLQGHTAMANPSALELNTQLTAASTEAADVAEADHLHDEALALAESMVADADLLIEDVMAELRFNTRRMDYPSQRRIQRTYGARFRTLPGEPSEGDRTQTIGTGDGNTTLFSATLAFPPVEPGSVVVSDGLEDFTDTPNTDGTGALSGSSSGIGTITYANGELTVKFATPPVVGATVTVQYFGAPD